MLTSVARPFLAAAFMLVAVRAFDPGDFSPFATLAIKAPTGAALFTVAVGALWLSQGRPDGAEKILFALARRRSQALRMKRFSRM